MSNESVEEEEDKEEPERNSLRSSPRNNGFSPLYGLATPHAILSSIGRHTSSQFN